MTAVTPDTVAIPAAGTEAPSRWGIRISTIVLCLWVLVPLYLLAVNAFNSR